MSSYQSDRRRRWEWESSRRFFTTHGFGPRLPYSLRLSSCGGHDKRCHDGGWPAIAGCPILSLLLGKDRKNAWLAVPSGFPTRPFRPRLQRVQQYGSILFSTGTRACFKIDHLGPYFSGKNAVQEPCT